MKFIYKIFANLIFVIHSITLLIILFGWTIPSIWYLYISILILTLISELVFGYCILSKWEFDLRKTINPGLNYDYHWATFYTYKFTQGRISEKFFDYVTVVFLVISLSFSPYFHFLS